MSGTTFPGDSDDSQSNFDDNFNNAQDAFNNTAKTISTAWIVGIVVIVVGFIVSVALGVWLLKRNRRRRRERQKTDDYVSPAAPLHLSGAQGGRPDTPQPYAQQMEHHEATPSPRREMPGSYYAPAPVEAQDTGVAYREAPNTEVAASCNNNNNNNNNKDSGPKHELSGIDSGRRELA